MDCYKRESPFSIISFIYITHIFIYTHTTKEKWIRCTFILESNVHFWELLTLEPLTSAHCESGMNIDNHQGACNQSELLQHPGLPHVRLLQTYTKDRSVYTQSDFNLVGQLPTHETILQQVNSVQHILLKYRAVNWKLILNTEQSL